MVNGAGVWNISPAKRLSTGDHFGGATLGEGRSSGCGFSAVLAANWTAALPRDAFPCPLVGRRSLVPTVDTTEGVGAVAQDLIDLDDPRDAQGVRHDPVILADINCFRRNTFSRTARSSLTVERLVRCFCRARFVLVAFMLAILQQNYASEKCNYFKAPPRVSSLLTAATAISG